MRGGGGGAAAAATADPAADPAADPLAAGAAVYCDDAAFDAHYLARRPEKHGSHSYVGRGLYAAQLRVWLEHFPREQILLLPLSQLKTRSTTTPTMRGVFSFLGALRFLFSPHGCRSHCIMCCVSVSLL